jgi:predicted MFS family arabinose efflux permease
MFTPVAGATAAAMVAPERRGAALAIVVAGLSGATALGAPIGTLVGNASDWHMTMWFVSLVGTSALVGVFAILPDVAAPPALRLRQRLAPLGDARVVATLLTTLLFMFGVFLIYTYISIVFDRATDGSGTVLAVLLSSWGIAATLGNLAAGSLSDRFGSRRVINVALVVVALDFALMPWIGAGFFGAAIAVAIWGFCGWGFVVSQQHRLVSIDAGLAPILLALNASAIYLAISAAAAVGALVVGVIDPHHLPLVTSVLVIASLFCAELAYRLIRGDKEAAAT